MSRRGRTRLATVLFTDIVGSSEIAVESGDRRWKALLEAHHAIVRRALKRHGGRELDTAGDGFFAVFGTQAEAIRCAAEIVQEVRSIGLEVRAGLHVGETELIAGKTGGVSVHTGARLGATAGPGEVVVSGVLRDLVPGSGIEFADRGTHRLKGIPDEVRAYSVRAVNGVDLGEPLDPAEASRRRSSVPAAPQRGRALVVGIVGGALAIGIAVALIVGGDPEGSDRSAPAPPIPPNTLLRVDPDTLRIEDRFPLGGDPAGLAWSAGRLWIDEGTILRVFDPRTGAFVGTPLGLGFRSCELAPTTGGVLLGDCARHRLYRVDVEGRITRSIDVPSYGNQMLLAESGDVVWMIASRDGGTVTDRLYKLDRTTGEVLGRAILQGSENDVFDLVEAAGWVWLYNYDTGEVSRVSPTTLTRERMLQLTQPNWLTSNGEWIWISDVGTGETVRIDPLNGDVEHRAERVQGSLTSGPDAAWVLDLERLYRVGVDDSVSGPVELSYEDSGSFDNPMVFDGASLWILVRESDE
ncbi:MAG TPA: adenylate/guanylate cyclase domain-containing protein [Actinomycetota bacterium]